MAQFKVLIADSRHPGYDEEKAVLSEIDAEVIIERSDDEEVMVKWAPEIDGLVVNLAPVTAKVIGAMTKCRCISRYGVGYDNVDLAALKGRDIILANVPDYCAEDVSDHAMALFLDGVRKISRKDRHVRKGEWNLVELQKVNRIRGRTFGFVGFGLIARTVLRKLSGFELGRILVSDPLIPKDVVEQAGAELVDLDTLCAESDYISLHAPVVPATKGMIGAAQLEKMKETAILINTARGPLIQEEALVEALKNGQIACAGLDVFENEPLAADHPLRALDNITLVDHAGWYSEEAMAELKTKAAKNVADVLKGGKPDYIVPV